MLHAITFKNAYFTTGAAECVGGPTESIKAANDSYIFIITEKDSTRVWSVG